MICDSRGSRGGTREDAPAEADLIRKHKTLRATFFPLKKKGKEGTATPPNQQSFTSSDCRHPVHVYSETSVFLLGLFYQQV